MTSYLILGWAGVKDALGKRAVIFGSVYFAISVVVELPFALILQQPLYGPVVATIVQYVYIGRVLNLSVPAKLLIVILLPTGAALLAAIPIMVLIQAIN